MHEQKMILTHKPQLNISYPSSGRMWLVSGCAFLCIVQSSISDGGRTLILVFTALFFALFIEYLLTWRNYGTAKIKDGSAAATALVLSILLPNQIPPVYAAFGAAFAVAIVKYSFGGLGSNWLNPALGGWLFIRFSWPGAYINALERPASSITEMNVTSGLSALDNPVTDFLNSSIFSATSVHLPPGYIDLLFYNGNSIIADKGLFFLLIGTIAITATGINRGWIPLAFLAVYGLLVRFAADALGQFGSGDVLYGIFSGGTIAAAFILAAEPASSAKLKSGILFTVVLGAFLSWFFRYRCLEYSGCFIAVAIVNCFTPLVKYAEENFLFYRKNRGKIQENAL